jgi:hypothetical protein
MLKKSKKDNIINQQSTENKISQLEIDKLLGVEPQDKKYGVLNKNEWKQCMYCDKFHHIDYYSSGMEYCIHCWAWLNNHEYNIETGIYTGVHSQNDINETLKKAYSVHSELKCTVQECLFNKIKKFAEIKLLHSSLVELLGLNKKSEQKAVNFNYKNKNLNVNFDESYIIV